MAEVDQIDAEWQASLAAVRNRRSRQTLFNVFGVLALVMAVLSGSVFAAHELAGGATKPDTATRSLLTNANIPLSQQAASCGCAPQHSATIAPPFLPSTNSGQVIIVSISKQQLWAFSNGRLFMTTLVTTGMPQLPTPQGAFHVFMKEADVMFYSPWPYGSPYYYTPEHIDYAMEFLAGGFYIHDAPWRETFGPGTNVPHVEPDGTNATGSHGCVNIPTSAAAQLYPWIGIGATVTIVY